MSKAITNTHKIFILIIFIAFVLRFYQLGSNPPSLNWDEASIGYNAYSILKTGRDEYGNFLPSSFRSFDDYKPPLYVYLTVPNVAIFGLSEFSVRLPAAIIGVLAVIMIYFFVKELFQNNKKNNIQNLALVSAFFLAISPWHLQFSRAAYEGNIGMFFLFLSLTFFLKALTRPINFIFFSIFFILSMYSYHSFRLLNPILLGLLILLYFKDIIKYKLIFFISLVVIVIFTQSIYLNFLKAGGSSSRLSMVTIFSSNQEKQIATALKLASAKQNKDLIGQIVNNRRFIFIPEIIKGYIDHFNLKYLFISGDGGVQHHAYNMGMLYLWDLPFIFLGVSILLRQIDKNKVLLFLTFFLAVVPSAITTGTPHPVRAIGMVPGFHIFAAVGFCGFLIYTKKLGKKMFLSLTSIVILVLAINISYYIYTYYNLTPIKYGYFWQFGNKEAIYYAKQYESKYNKIIMSYHYDQPYIYYLFHNKIDPGWYQKNWNYSGNGDIDRFYRKIGKYEFRNIDFIKDQVEKNTLLIAAPSEIPKERTPDSVIYFPDGSVAYKIISL